MTDFASFATALLAPDAQRPEFIVAPDGRPATSRFDVYRNNVTIGLTEALQTSFPVVRQLVGPEFFSGMAREFLRARPPASPVLAFYGDAFPDWLAGFPPVKGLPYLPGVARLEHLRIAAANSADAGSLDPAALGAVPPEELAELKLRPHPAARWMTDSHTVLRIWKRHNGEPEASDLAGEILICRPMDRLIQLAAPDGTCSTLDALRQGLALGDALPDAADHGAIFAALFKASALLPLTYSRQGKD